MAPIKKFKDVAKFGGTEHLGNIKGDVLDTGLKDVKDTSSTTIETKSDTNLEMDQGYGDAAVLRMFEFQGNPEVFRMNPPTRQDLFNAHMKGIEIALWRDNLTPIPEITPRIHLSERTYKYRIWVTAKAAKGHILSARDVPKTLSEIVHG